MDDRQVRPLGEVLERLIDDAEQGTPPLDAMVGKVLPPQVPSSAAAGLLGGLLSNPALLSGLPQLLSGLGSLSGGASPNGENKNRDDASAIEADPKKGESQGVSAPVRTMPPDRHTALLCALKPYLGAERRQAADYLISLCRVWGTLQSMGINLPALLLPGQGSVKSDDLREV